MQWMNGGWITIIIIIIIIIIIHEPGLPIHQPLRTEWHGMGVEYCSGENSLALAWFGRTTLRFLLRSSKSF